MTEILSSLSNGLAGAVDAASPAVVRVEARPRLAGSGIVWNPEGIIVTAQHIIEREDNLKVGLPDGRTVPAVLVGADQATDLAVLRAEAKDLTPAGWAEAANTRVGHLVLALGRPGRGVQATLGIVSALGEGWRTPAGGNVDRYLQTDVVMYPGFSGGPLVDVEGEALGLNTSAFRGVSLTIPLTTLRRVVDMILTFGRVRRGYGGVATQPVRLPEALAQQVGQETGLLVVSVEASSPADSAGVLLGDILVGLEGKPLRSLDELLASLSDDRIGVAMPLTIVRGGQARELTLTIGERS